MSSHYVPLVTKEEIDGLLLRGEMAAEITLPMAKARDILLQAASAISLAQFPEPSWNDEAPDWCTPKEEEIWEMGYNCAMSACRAAHHDKSR